MHQLAQVGDRLQQPDRADAVGAEAHLEAADQPPLDPGHEREHQHHQVDQHQRLDGGDDEPVRHRPAPPARPRRARPGRRRAPPSPAARRRVRSRRLHQRRAGRRAARRSSTVTRSPVATPSCLGVVVGELDAAAALEVQLRGVLDVEPAHQLAVADHDRSLRLALGDVRRGRRRAGAGGRLGAHPALADPGPGEAGEGCARPAMSANTAGGWSGRSRPSRRPSSAASTSPSSTPGGGGTAARSRCTRPSRLVNVPSFSSGIGDGHDGRRPAAGAGLERAHLQREEGALHQPPASARRRASRRPGRRPAAPPP